MALINRRALGSMVRTMGTAQTVAHITESLGRTREGESGHLRPEDFSIRDLAESVVEGGREWVDSMNPARGEDAMESSGVDSTAFANIIGQIAITKTMEAYRSPAFSVSAAMRTMPTRLSGERIPGISSLGDKAQEVGEGQEYPHAAVTEDYIDTPETTKNGLITAITKEAVFFDRTGLLLNRQRDVGRTLGLNKEKRCVDVLIGAVNNYKWRGTTYNTYIEAQAQPFDPENPNGTLWRNQLKGADFDLQDWEQVDAANQLFNEIVDPNTGEPVVMMADTLIATEAKEQHINRIINATEVRDTTSGGRVQTLAANPLRQKRGFTNKFIYSRLQSQLGLTAEQARKTWFYGEISEAFYYMENWGLTVVQAPTNNEAEFARDVVARFKASERGVPASVQPRAIARVFGFDEAIASPSS